MTDRGVSADLPLKIVIDKGPANTHGIKNINRILKRFDCVVPAKMVRINSLNNRIEQDHASSSVGLQPMLCFKNFTSVPSTLTGVEAVTMIRRAQFTPELRPF